MAFIYKQATVTDLDLLTETRVQVLLAANGLPDHTDMEEVRRQTRRYYQTALPDGSHIAYLVFDGSRFAGAGGVSFFQVMPTYHNPSGKKAYIMNVYTCPVSLSGGRSTWPGRCSRRSTPCESCRASP